MTRDDDTRVIGYFAYTPPMHAVCHWNSPRTCAGDGPELPEAVL